MTPLLKKTSLGMLAALVVVLILRAATEEHVLEIIVGKSIEEAEAIRVRIKAGESFEELALRYSIDPSAAEGGYLGKVKVDGLRPEVQDAVKGLATGDVSAVFPIALKSRDPENFEPAASARV